MMWGVFFIMNKYTEFLKSFNKSVLSARRDIEEIELIAVSKKKSIDIISEVINLGCVSFGENQIQEIDKKWEHLKKQHLAAKLHFIGGIQSRKLKRIFETCEAIHSIDRIKIVKLVKDLENETGTKKDYFIQVNTGDEHQKYGVSLNKSEEFISECIDDYNLDVKGLMCIPPLNENPLLHFKRLNSLGKNFNLPYLSMGMSNDYDIAIKCGSTHVRIGSKIFGKRE